MGFEMERLKGQRKGKKKEYFFPAACQTFHSIPHSPSLLNRILKLILHDTPNSSQFLHKLFIVCYDTRNSHRNNYFCCFSQTFTCTMEIISTMVGVNMIYVHAHVHKNPCACMHMHIHSTHTLVNISLLLLLHIPMPICIANTFIIP